MLAGVVSSPLQCKYESSDHFVVTNKTSSESLAPDQDSHNMECLIEICVIGEDNILLRGDLALFSSSLEAVKSAFEVWVISI